MLEEALALIEEHGHASLTLREVARRIGVSHAAPYRHFADRRALMTELAIQAAAEIAARTQAALDGAGDDIRARFLSAGFVYVHFALDRPALFQAAFSGEADAEDPRMQEAKQRSFGILLEFIEAAQRVGAFRPGPPEELARSVWAMHHGLATLAAAGAFAAHGPEGLRRVSDDAHARLLDGLMLP